MFPSTNWLTSSSGPRASPQKFEFVKCWKPIRNAVIHDYTHAAAKTSGADGTGGMHVLRDI